MHQEQDTISHHIHTLKHKLLKIFNQNPTKSTHFLKASLIDNKSKTKKVSRKPYIFNGFQQEQA